MNKYNRKPNIPPLATSKDIIKVIALFATLTVGVISNANATQKPVAERSSRTNTELLISQKQLNNDNCYHKNMAYSQGSLIVMEVDNEPKQFKCTTLNSYELNGKLGWKELGANKSNEVKSKLTITRE